MELARLVLSKLEKTPLRWTPLLKALIRACGSPPRLYYVLKYLERNGFVCRVLVDGKSHWSITDKGRELLRILSEDAHTHACQTDSSLKQKRERSQI